jgi:hypothetical protein
MDINRLIQSNSSITPLMNILNIINSPIIISNPNNILNRSFQEQEIQKHPTEKNFIDSLEIVEFDEDQKEIYCGICLDNFKNGDKAYILPCKDQKHYFHIGENKESCGGILPWLEENNTCPVCRETFPEEKDEDILEEDYSDEDYSDEDYSDDIPVPNGNFDTENNDNDLNEEEENNLISEFLSGITNIDEDGEEEDVENPETMIENFINQLMGSTENQQDIRIISSNPLIQILNNVQQEMNEDYQLQQAIQRSITER